MTSSPIAPAPVLSSVADHDVRTLIAIPALAGAALSLVDLLVMKHIPFPFAILANTSAVWAIGAFALGAVQRLDPVKSAIAGVVMMLVAVESYYVFASLAGMSDWSTLISPNTRTWLLFGLAAGSIFGVAGAWTSTGTYAQKTLGAALGGGVLIGEALHTFVAGAAVGGTMGRVFASDLVSAAFMTAMLGLAVTAVSARTSSVLAGAVALLLPISVCSAIAFAVVGIAY